MPSPDIPGGRDMPLSGHLAELRGRLLRVAVPMLAALPVALLLAPRLLDALFAPLSRLGCAVYRYGVWDGLSLLIRAALLLEVVAFSPLIAWQAARFLRPGLYRGERRTALLLSLAVGALFAAGVFAYLRCAVGPLTALWYRDATVFLPQLSATECYGLHLFCMSACGLAAASPALLIPAVRLYRKKRKENRP